MITIQKLSVKKRWVEVGFSRSGVLDEEDEKSAKKVAMDTVLRFHFKEGATFDEADWEEAMRFDAVLNAKTAAFAILSRSLKTEKELKQKLKEKGFPGYATEAAIEAAKEYGYLSDEAYARAYAARYQGRGKRRIEQELKQRGVSREAMEETLDARDDHALCLAAAERYLRGKTWCPEVRERMIRHLGSRGFGYSQIKDAIAKLAVTDNGEEENYFDD